MPAADADLNRTARAAELTARTAYGRLLAFLATRTRDVGAVEDALADAFAAALASWPDDGAPARPEAWLLTAARNRLADGARHARVRAGAAPAITWLLDAPAEPDGGVPDRRLRLLLACAHPAVPEETKAPLMLQVVLGLTAARIGSAWLTSPAAMAQRLVRAKAALKGHALDLPDAADLAERHAAVLRAVYAAATCGWDDPAGADLAEEAVFLARLTAELLPGEPEARGLLALLLHVLARRPAARDAGGRYVPLAAQDRRTWQAPLAAEAEHHLRAAARLGRPGRFQIEAAIQSAHATGAPPGAIVTLYDALLALAPSVGAAVGRGAALGEAEGPATGLAALDALPPDAVAQHQPFWAVRGDLMRRCGRDSTASYDRAIGLTTDPSIRAFLLERRRARTP